MDGSLGQRVCLCVGNCVQSSHKYGGSEVQITPTNISPQKHINDYNNQKAKQLVERSSMTF